MAQELGRADWESQCPVPCFLFAYSVAEKNWVTSAVDISSVASALRNI